MRSIEDLRSIAIPFHQAELWPRMHAPHIDLGDFRNQNYYLYQRPEQEKYTQFVHDLQAKDDWQLLETLTEDTSFGAITFEVDGRTVSRDLLDSIWEITYLKNMLGWQRDQAVQLIDVGAGYGRLAHRLTQAMPNAHAWCVDAIAESTWLAQFYLNYRNCTRGHVVPFDNLAALTDKQFDVATAIHSWSECSPETVDWWVALLRHLRVPNILFIGGILCTWGSPPVLIEAIIAAYGYSITDRGTGDLDECHYILFHQDFS